MAISLGALGVNVDRLYHGQPPTTGAALYTAPGSGQARSQVTAAIIANPSPSPIAVRLGLIPSGGSNDGTHYLLGDQPIPANSSLLLNNLGLSMRPGDVLHGTSGPLPGPIGLVATGSTSGGTLAAGTYYYKITGTNANGETVASTNVSVGATGSTASVVLTWTRSLGVTGYNIYRGTASGLETLLGAVSGGGTVTYTDTGATAGATAAPSTGTAAGCIFTISGAELPA